MAGSLFTERHVQAIIIVAGVLPLAFFPFKTFSSLKTERIKDGESVWDRLGIDLWQDRGIRSQDTNPAAMELPAAGL